jgi:hypothetical protein
METMLQGYFAFLSAGRSPTFGDRGTPMTSTGLQARSAVSTHMHKLTGSVTRSELEFIAARDGGRDKARQLVALEKLIFEQYGIITPAQFEFPYKVIELGACFEPAHERECAICCLLIIANIKAGTDNTRSLEEFLDLYRHHIRSLPNQLSDLVLQECADQP